MNVGKDRLGEKGFRRVEAVDPDVIPIGAVLTALRRSLWIILLATFSTGFVSWFYASVKMPPLFTSEASIVMATREFRVVDIADPTEDLPKDQVTLNTELSVLTSPELLGQVTDQLDLTRDPEFNPFLLGDVSNRSTEISDLELRSAAVATLDNKIDVWNPTATLILKISVTTSSADKSALIANTLANQYVQSQLELKRRAAEEASDWLNVRIKEIQREIENTEAKIRELEFDRGSDINNTRSRVLIQQLNDESEILLSLNQSFVSRLRETLAQVGLLRADSRVLSAASPDHQPSSPNVELIAAAGSLVGLFLGLLLTFLREQTVKGFRSADELSSATGIRVLGRIPKFNRLWTRDWADLGNSRRAKITLEAIEELRISLTPRLVERPSQVVLLCASTPGEGCSSLALALSGRIGASGARTLLIDGDLRHGQLGAFASKGASPNALESAILDPERLSEVVLEHPKLRCDVLASGSSRLDPSLGLQADVFDAFLQQARKKYHMIVIDTPPLLAVPDALSIAPLADQLLFVVKSRRSDRKAVREALELLTNVDVIPDMLVMNMVPENEISRSKYRKYYTKRSA